MAIKSKDILKLYGAIEKMHNTCANKGWKTGCNNCPYIETECSSLGDIPEGLDMDNVYTLFEWLEKTFERRKE